MRTVEYCREIETYLCKKNDGHLIRVVGPSFDLVSGWASEGIPLKIAIRGIDRYFERYYRKGPRRRPVRIDFCDADVREIFDEWRRALGVAAGEAQNLASEPVARERSGRSLPAHLQRVVLRLSEARASGSLDAGFDEVIDRVARELDAACAESRGVRGETRVALLARLAALDAELVRSAHETLGERAQAALVDDAEAELAPFRTSMRADAFARALSLTIDRLVRERFGLPVVTFG